MDIKEPNCAGTFYLGDEVELSSQVSGYLNEVSYDGEMPRAIIAPHAGHIYSGPVAASAYIALKKYASKIKRVAIFSPTHYYNFEGVASANFEAFATPLGKISCDLNGISNIVESGAVSIVNEVFFQEHALEVHLPFLQSVLSDFTLLPFIVGVSSANQVLTVLDTIYDESTLVVISSDLSHFLDYELAKKTDRKTADLILNCDGGAIDGKDACGKYPLNGFLSWVKKHNFKIQEVDLRNSGDTAGDKSRVVGYGSFIVT